MKFLRGLTRGIAGEGGTERADAEPPEDAPDDSAEADASEREHELEVLRAEQQRLDELAQRQQRYARYAWQPPVQGGERRADDHEAPEKEP
jgi:hypothetical protein